MKLILIRHGEAEPSQYPDSSRQLTDFGQQQAEETADYIMKKYTPDLLVVSPYDRAKKTLQSFKNKTPNTPAIILDAITPDGNVTQAIKELSKLSDKNEAINCVLVVCHMPIIAKIVAELVGKYPTPYQLAEARVLDCEVIAENLATQIDRFIPMQIG